MDKSTDYIMEHDKETIRLEVKTDVSVVQQQAQWAGIEPGMRVADVGCGPGKTSRTLFDTVSPGGEVVGIDIVQQRVVYAQKKYQVPGITFEHRDAREPLDDLGQFDFIWVRFLLEYYASKAFGIVKNLYRILKPGGIICLIDLDHNCMNHYGVPDRLIQALNGSMACVQQNADFDPYVGRKLYSFLFDMKCDAIDVSMAAHHLIFGELSDVDAFNWNRKTEIGIKNSGFDFTKVYPGGYDEFFQEYKQCFKDPRRFTYTPVIATRGRKPLQGL